MGSTKKLNINASEFITSIMGGCIFFSLFYFGPVNSSADENRENIVWEDLDHSLLKSREKLKVTLVYVQTKGCGPCSMIEKKIFPQLSTILQQLVLVKIDFDDRSTRMLIDKLRLSPFEWAREYNIDATPGFALIDSKGKHILSHVGLIDSRALGTFLSYGSTGAYEHVSFAEYVRSFATSNLESFSEHIFRDPNLLQTSLLNQVGSFGE